MMQLESAAQSFYDFICELDRSARFQNLLSSLPDFGDIDRADNPFTVNKRLAAIVFCDVRDCFLRLGHSPSRLDNLAGMGYVMIVALLANRNIDIGQCHDRLVARELARIFGRLEETSTITLNIEGHENEFRFAFLFGTVNKETELVQRYSTLLYRWASLVAKADGVVTSRESAVLADIMKMRNPVHGGDVQVVASSRRERMPATDGVDRSDRAAVRPDAIDMDVILTRLDGLIGLVPVKSEIRKLISFIEIQRKRRSSGLKMAPISYHCVFTGNPGTGKTTVARIIADVYKALGIVGKGHLVETDRSGLIGEYVGQTAVKTNKIIDSALDGVLFIDEAYSLVQGGEKDYGPEAIATLLKRMEDDRDRLIVILAGYSGEMREFIESNPGLRSRFNRYIEFPDYSAEELSRIFLSLSEKSQYTCNADVRNSLNDIMERAIMSKDRSFGNGRFVRNLFENAIQRQAVRLSTVAPLTTEMLSELTLHDLGYEYEEKAG